MSGEPRCSAGVKQCEELSTSVCVCVCVCYRPDDCPRQPAAGGSEELQPLRGSGGAVQYVLHQAGPASSESLIHLLSHYSPGAAVCLLCCSDNQRGR